MIHDVVYTKISLQKALLGDIAPSFRGIAFMQASKEINIYYYIDGALSEEDKESISLIETEVLADFPWDYVIRSIPVRVDYPKPLELNKNNWVYLRRE